MPSALRANVSARTASRPLAQSAKTLTSVQQTSAAQLQCVPILEEVIIAFARPVSLVHHRAYHAKVCYMMLCIYTNTCAGI